MFLKAKKDLAISYLSKKIGITKEVILNELNYQSNNELDDAPRFKKSDINHINAFQEILIANLIKSKFEYDDEIEYLLDS